MKTIIGIRIPFKTFKKIKATFKQEMQKRIKLDNNKDKVKNEAVKQTQRQNIKNNVKRMKNKVLNLITLKLQTPIPSINEITSVE